MSMHAHVTRLTVPVSERDHSLGPADAPVTLLEYGDYECPYCGRAFPIVHEVRRRLGDPTFYINGVRHDADYALETLLAAIEEAASAPL